MLHLETGIDLEEIEIPVVEDELDRPCIDISRGTSGADRGLAHFGSQLCIHRRRRRLFHDLLMASLDRALALAQVDRGAVAVADDLDLDMARPAGGPHHVDGRGTESRARGPGPTFD